MKIAIMLFEQADPLDFGGPYEVFLTASRLAARESDVEPFNVTTVSMDGLPITAYGGMQITPDAAIDDAMPFDMLLVPGGIDVNRFLADKLLIKTIADVARSPNMVVSSVCTGAFILAEAGLLDDLDWTTHWEDMDELSEKLGHEGARKNVHWVDNGNVITGAGLSSGLAMSLHLVHRFSNLELATKTARQIGYTWSADGVIR